MKDGETAGPCPINTLVCCEPLRLLAENLGRDAALAFVERFVRLWPQRRERLHLAVNRHDADSGRDAALSLSSSASMAGAYRLANLASRMHGEVPLADTPDAWTAAAGLLGELDRLGAASTADVVRLSSRLAPAEDSPRD